MYDLHHMRQVHPALISPTNNESEAQPLERALKANQELENSMTEILILVNITQTRDILLLVLILSSTDKTF